MKKTIYMTAIIAIIMIATGCKDRADNYLPPAREAVYTGILPAADTDGVIYTLYLDYDKDGKNFTKGDYALTCTYLRSDSTAVGGIKSVKSFRSEGDFDVLNGKSLDKKVQYISLRPDSKHTIGTPNSEQFNFVITSDSTLMLVNSELQPAETNGQAYVLTRNH